RGGGEILGTRQSGEVNFYFVDFNNQDMNLIQDINKEIMEKKDLTEIDKLKIDIFSGCKEV
ncbi:MAG TPA: hypothetical protein QKA14_02555, partial [Candidatus Megaira endosymbiont of Hartmannula sinica]|nr:hypothetical protein [Candidatus Megaera endosymbiont of Hartmannula sinica]